MNQNEYVDENGTMNEDEARREITKLFAYHGFHDYVKIDKEAIGMLLSALRDRDVRTVRSNGDGGIVIEYNDDGSLGDPYEQ